MAENLGIRIVTNVDEKASAKEINKSLRMLESKVDKLDLGIDFKGFQKELNKAVNGFDTKTVESKLEKAFDVPTQKIKQNNKKIGREISKLQQKYGGVITGVQTSKDADGAINNALVTMKDYNNELTRSVRLRNSLGEIEVTDTKEVQNIEKARKTQQKLKDDRENYVKWWRQQLNNIEQKEEKTAVQQRKQAEKYENWWQKALKEREIRQEKVQKKEHESAKKYEQWWKKALKDRERKEKDLQHTIEQAQRQARVKAGKLLSEKKKYISDDQRKAINNYVDSMDKLTANTPEARKAMQNLNMSFRETKGEIDKVANKTMTLTGRFKEAISSSVVWAGAMTTVYGSLAALTTAISVVTDLDTSITNLKKVMDQDTDFDAMLDDAIVKAKQLGQTVTGVLDSFEEGGRQGLNAQDINFLSEASLLSANVGEIEAGKAAEYLTAAIAQMKMEYKDSMSIIDSWNEVNL